MSKTTGTSSPLTVMSRTAKAGFVGNVAEGSVTIVVVKRAAQRLGRFVNIGGRGLDEVEVHETVLVIVEPGDSSSHGFKVVPFVRGGGVLKKSNTGGLLNVNVADGRAVVFYFWNLRENYNRED